jgi:hypothetical protein
MSMPGFSADAALRMPVQARRQGIAKSRQRPAPIVPALHTENWYPCYSRADGTTGWCGEICEDDSCYTTWD